MRNLKAAEMVAAIRTEYPDVRPCSGRVHGGYCVGSAFMMFIGHMDRPRFVAPSELSVSLRHSGVALQDEDDYANDIIIHNDAGRMDKAWTALQRALESAEVLA